jgi:hypothetical protein
VKQVRSSAACSSEAAVIVSHPPAQAPAATGLGSRCLYEAQQISAPATPKVTMRYAHLSARALQDAANAASVIVRRPVVVAEPEALPEAA